MPPTSPGRKRGIRKLSEFAKHLVAPTDITSTDWPAVEKTCREKLGIGFDDWQIGSGRLILARRADGNLAAMVDGVGMSLPRQVGKTYLLAGIIFALCVNQPGLLVIWSAHHARTHGETFLSMQGFAKRHQVKPHVANVYVGSGDEEIRFHNNSRILFGARERGFGRGIAAVDALIFDEAQILSDRALANMLATMNRSKLGLALYIGTPPRPEDNAEAFKRMRADALNNRLTDGAWIELGAEKGADPSDRKQWAKANPSYPVHTPPESMLRLQRKLTPEDFLHEGLGIWDEEGLKGPFSSGVWMACGTHDEPPEPTSLGLALDIDRVWLSLGAASPGYVGAVERVRFDIGGDSLFDQTVEIALRHSGLSVAIDARGPAASLIERLEDKGITVLRAGLDDYVQACADLYDGVEAKELQHGDHDELNRAVMNAGWRNVGSETGRRVWSRKNGDVSMLEAVTLAAWGTGNSYDVLDSIL